MPSICRDQQKISDVTFIIKTFERFFCVRRLVKSILKYYPNAKILIADDSELSCKEYFDHFPSEKKIEVYEVGRDCGLSYGRNYLVRKVSTRYFVLLDDDYVFDENTDIVSMIECLERHNLDIIGGYHRNYSTVCNVYGFLKVWIQNLFGYCRPHNYIGSLNYDESERVLYADYCQKEFPTYLETDITHNFFWQ